MQSNNLYVRQESLESVNEWIENSLTLGSSVLSIAKAMLGTVKAELIITKECNMFMQELNNDEIVGLLQEYINECFGYAIKKSYVSDIVKGIIEKYFNENSDKHSDYLTDLFSKDAYKSISHYIDQIIIAYEPYMKEKYPVEFEKMSMSDHEVALIKFVKEHLVTFSTK